MYRVTNYSVDFAGAKGKTYSARFDAVGRLKDIYNNAELQRETGKNAHGDKASDAEAKKVETYVKKYLPDAQIEGVYKSEQGGNFYYADLKNGEMIVNDQGQVYSFREEIKLDDLPDPVEKTIKEMFSAQPVRTRHPPAIAAAPANPETCLLAASESLDRRVMIAAQRFTTIVWFRPVF